MTDIEHSDLRAAALLELHDSRKSVKVHSARLVQMAAALENASTVLRALGNHHRLDNIVYNDALISAVPPADALLQAAAEVTRERDRLAAAREQAQRLDLLDD